MKSLIKIISEESITDIQYNECIKCIEYYQNAEIKNESIFNNISNSISENINKIFKRKDIYKLIWTELENFLRAYSDLSDRHKLIYNHVKKIKQRSDSLTDTKKPVLFGSNKLNINTNIKTEFGKFDPLDKPIVETNYL